MQAGTAFLLALALVAAPRMAPAVLPLPIVVNSTGDAVANDNRCTLREAIIAAKTNAPSSDTTDGCAGGLVAPAVDTIAFDIPAGDAGCSGGICTIALSNPLPDITEPVFINGYSQPNAVANGNAFPAADDAVILIRIDASNISGTALHLASGSDGSTVQGLSIVKASGNATPLSYLMTIDSNTNSVAGNFIGVEPDGSTVSTQLVTSGAMYVHGSSNTIGGTTAAARNLVTTINAGNTYGVVIDGTSNLVQGNYFDLDATGNVGIGSAVIAVYVDAGGNTIGGAGVAGNAIGKWTTAGLQISRNSPFSLSGAVSVKGNRVGTNAAGTAALAAGPYGIFVGTFNGSLTIGGSAAYAGNVIHGSLDGIQVSGSPTAGIPVVIQGNRIGICADGAAPAGSLEGINVASSGVGGLIGGTTSGEGNVIACNGTDGVTIASATGWAVLGNSIYGNGFGITLGGRPTPNDFNDADTGPNNLQNYPVLGAGVVGPKTTVQVSGSLNSEANKTYRLEFFANANCDKSGHGQGKVFVGTTDVMTNPNDVAFGPLALTTPIDRHVITATATDPDGNTSEFSDCSHDDTIFTDSLEGD